MVDNKDSPWPELLERLNAWAMLGASESAELTTMTGVSENMPQPMFALVGESVDHIVRLMRENITGVRVIRALSQVNHEMERFQQGNHSLTKQDSKAGMTMALPNPVMNLFLNLGLTLIILIGAYRVNMGLMKTGVILAFLTYFNMILQAVMGINRIFILYSKAGASANRIDEVLHLENPFKIQDNYLEGDKKDVVRFNNVTFSYHVSSAGQRNALQSISFCIKEGGSLGIIGSTGSGKSTIMNLLMRRYEVTQGDIYVNGSNICTLPFEQLRNKMGVVLQNDTIFQDSILENITLGRELSLSEVKWAATCAGIAEHIESLPNTYEYRVSIKGMNLSGGQRQRLLLARALAGRPEILILDDSSSALDYVTEANLRNNLKVMYQSCAQIIIAQRISSVRDLDQILVLEDGEAVGLDTHEVLLETCEIYRDIYRSQMGEELGGDLLCHR